MFQLDVFLHFSTIFWHFSDKIVNLDQLEKRGTIFFFKLDLSTSLEDFFILSSVVLCVCVHGVFIWWHPKGALHIPLFASQICAPLVFSSDLDLIRKKQRFYKRCPPVSPQIKTPCVFVCVCVCQLYDYFLFLIRMHRLAALNL